MNITLSFEDFMTQVNKRAGICLTVDHCGTYDEQTDEVKDKVKAQYNAIFNFSFITQNVYDQQVKDYEKAYMGEDANVGDLMWTDGECECGLSILEQWMIQSIDETGTRGFLDWEEIAQQEKELQVVNVFEIYMYTKGTDINLGFFNKFKP